MIEKHFIFDATDIAISRKLNRLARKHRFDACYIGSTFRLAGFTKRGWKRLIGALPEIERVLSRALTASGSRFPIYLGLYASYFGSDAIAEMRVVPAHLQERIKPVGKGLYPCTPLPGNDGCVSGYCACPGYCTCED